MLGVSSRKANPVLVFNYLKRNDQSAAAHFSWSFFVKPIIFDANFLKHLPESGSRQGGRWKNDVTSSQTS